MAPSPQRIPKPERRFYRPELDALRFLAFFGVLIHHGPAAPFLLQIASAAGSFGLSMFFLLSAYLITELLLRERAEAGTVSWSRFFVRRALRIWPLYYAFLILAVLLSLIPPHRLWASPVSVVAMGLFAVNWFQIASQTGAIISHLWSISVEEQFYLIWPPLIKLGGRRFALIASIGLAVVAVVWLWNFSGRGWKLWYDTPVEFVFFGAGATVAIAAHGKSLPRLSIGTRGVLLFFGFAALWIAAYYGGIGQDGMPGLTKARLYLGYGSALAGCLAIFLASFGEKRIPRPLIYLGKISYGLYVFHVPAIHLSHYLVARLNVRVNPWTNMGLVDGVALFICILSAHLSYQHFESPFLRIKDRFAVVKSRPI